MVAKKINWTAEQDQQILNMRAAKDTWVKMAAVMRLSRVAIIARARVLGVFELKAVEIALRKESTATGLPPRPVGYAASALPAGHPSTWGLLTDGTVLQGSAYPTYDTKRIK